MRTTPQVPSWTHDEPELEYAGDWRRDDPTEERRIEQDAQHRQRPEDAED